jgi:hypothetical protein
MLLDDRTQRFRKREQNPTIEDISDRATWKLGTVAAAWPELSEFDCYACHHDIKTPSWRRKLVYTPESGNGAAPRKRSPGTLPWGTWYFSLVSERMLVQADLGGADVSAGAVRNEMEERAVDIELASSAAKGVATNLNCLAQQFSGKPITLDTINRSLTVIGELPATDSWDEATQRYLALVALIKSHRRLAAGPARLDYEGIKLRLEAIRQDLRFDPAFSSPSHIDVDRMEALRTKFKELVPLLTR